MRRRKPPEGAMQIGPAAHVVLGRVFGEDNSRIVRGNRRLLTSRGRRVVLH